MENISGLIVVGAAVVFALFAGKMVGRFRAPVVIGYILIGIILGKSFLHVFNAQLLEKVSVINDLALGIIAFMIGGELNFSRLKSLSRSIFFIAIFESLGAFVMVSFFSFLLIKKIHYALILGAIASATAPAATVAVINQYKAKGPLTMTLLGVVGMDDAVALIIYAFAAAVSYPFVVHHAVPLAVVLSVALKEVCFSIACGGFLGVALGYLLNKIRTAEDIFALILGVILIAEGVAVQFGLSELLLVMTMAVVTTNIAPTKVSSVMKNLNLVGFPLIAAFFCLAATRLDITLLPQIGLLGFVYLLARMLGKYGGAWFGASISKSPDVIKKYIGLALWPQIGVAVALAIMVEKDFAGTGEEGKYLTALAVNVLLFTTIFTEIIGPLATKFALTKAKEVAVE